MRTLGIDLSANPAKTGACEVDWDTGAITFLDRPTSDEQLVEAVQRADLTAIDVPLGWPDGFIDAVVAHRDHTGWPPIGTAPPEDRIALRYRTTDLVTRTGGSRPLSVSSDLIGVAAMRGARIQHLLETAGVPVDRSGVTGRIIEAYPAAALRVWGLSSSKYKGTTNAEACRILARKLTDRCGPLSAAAARMPRRVRRRRARRLRVRCSSPELLSPGTPPDPVLNTSRSLAEKDGFMSPASTSTASPGASPVMLRQ